MTYSFDTRIQKTKSTSLKKAEKTKKIKEGPNFIQGILSFKIRWLYTKGLLYSVIY